MLAVEVDQVVFELLVQKSFPAAPHHLLGRRNQVVLVVVHSDGSSWSHFDVSNTLSADSGLPQHTVSFFLWSHLLKEGATGFLRQVLIFESWKK